MKKLMIAASVAAVGLAAVADVYNVKFTTTTPVVASKKVSGTDTTYLKKGTVTINGVCSVKNGELGKYYFWSGTGKSMAPVQNAVFELSNITNMDANVNGKNAALNVALYVGSGDNELVSYFVSGGLASMEVAGGSNFKSASGSFGGTYGSLPAYGTWSLSKNAAATKVGDDDRGMAEYVAKQGAKSTMGKSGPVVVSDWDDNSEFAERVLSMADLQEKLQEIDVLISTIENQGYEIATLEEGLFIANETIAANEATIAANEATIAANEAKITELTTANGELTEELAAKVAELETANADLEAANNELLLVKQELEFTIAAKDALEEAKAELEGYLAEKAEKWEVEVKEKALDTLKDLVTKLEDMISERDETIAGQATEIGEKDTLITALQSTLENVKAELDALLVEEEKPATLEETIEGLKTQIAEMDALIAEMAKAIEDLTDENAGLKDELAIAGDTILKQIDQINELIAKGEEDAATIADLTAKKEELEATLAEIDAAMVALDEPDPLGLGYDKLLNAYLSDIIANQKRLSEQAKAKLDELAYAISVWEAGINKDYAELDAAVVAAKKELDSLQPAAQAGYCGATYEDNVKTILEKTKASGSDDWSGSFGTLAGEIDADYQAWIAGLEGDIDWWNNYYDGLKTALETTGLPTDIANLEAAIAADEAALVPANDDLEVAQKALADYTEDGKPNYWKWLAEQRALDPTFEDSVENRTIVFPAFYQGLVDDVEFCEAIVKGLEDDISDMTEELTRKKDLLARIEAASTPAEKAAIIDEILAEEKAERDIEVARAQFELAGCKAVLAKLLADLPSALADAKALYKAEGDDYDAAINAQDDKCTAAWDAYYAPGGADEASRNARNAWTDAQDDAFNARFDIPQCAIDVHDVFQAADYWGIYPCTEGDVGYDAYVEARESYETKYTEMQTTFSETAEYAQFLLDRLNSLK